MSPTVQGYCPSCGGASLFLGAGGYVTCSRSDCANPSAAADLLYPRAAVEVVKPGQVAADAADLRPAPERSWPLKPGDAESIRQGAIRECAETDSWQGERFDPEVEGADEYGTPVDTPAAEPDTERGNCQRCGNDAALTWGVCSPCFEHVDSEVRAESVRVTLPDTPWTTVLVTLPRGLTETWHTGSTPGLWRDPHGAQIMSPGLARVVSYEILAEPPRHFPNLTKAIADHNERNDPADTDAPKPWATLKWERTDWYAKNIEDRAAKRGRDEALAVVVQALRLRRGEVGASTNLLHAFDITILANVIEHIQAEATGRDGEGE